MMIVLKMGKMVLMLFMMGMIWNMNHAVPLDDTDLMALSGKYGQRKYCMTPECIRIAKSIRNNMDSNQDPCVDFYKFACGNFVSKTEIPKRMTMKRTFHAMSADDVISRLQTAFTTSKKNELKVFGKLKTFYNLCMDEDLKKQQGTQPLFKFIEKLGGWPLLMGDKWNESSFYWLDAMIEHRRLGFVGNDFQSMHFTNIPENGTVLISVYGAMPRLWTQPLQRGTKNDIKLAYRQHIIDLAYLLGGDTNISVKEIENVIELEEEINTLSNLYGLELNAVPQMTVKELSSKFPAVPWKKYLTKMAAPFVNITDDDSITSNSIEYLVKIINIVESREKKTQANYAMLSVVKEAANFLRGDISMFADDMKRHMLRSPVTPMTPERCILMAVAYLPLATEALYISNYVPKNSKQMGTEIVTDVREAMQDILKQVDWMDLKTKEKAQDKAKSMIAEIAHEDNLINGTFLEHYHEDLIIEPTNYLEAFLGTAIFYQKTEFEHLRNSVNLTRQDNLFLTNVYFHDGENKAYIPIGILQGKLFNITHPQYMNYARLGFNIAREISHAFDKRGSEYNKYGNREKWWTSDTNLKFLERTRCGLWKATGYCKLHEYFGDEIGIKGAYSAYTKWLHRNENELQLPGLNYTSEQMFWISNANMWCAKYRPDDMKKLPGNMPINLEKLQVTTIYSNNDDFAKDFKCPISSKMNLKHKCYIW